MADDTHIEWQIDAGRGLVIIEGGGLRRPWEISLQQYTEMGWSGMPDRTRAAKLVAMVLKEVDRRRRAVILPEGRHDRGWPQLSPRRDVT